MSLFCSVPPRIFCVIQNKIQSTFNCLIRPYPMWLPFVSKQGYHFFSNSISYQSLIICLPPAAPPSFSVFFFFSDIPDMLVPQDFCAFCSQCMIRTVCQHLRDLCAHSFSVFSQSLLPHEAYATTLKLQATCPYDTLSFFPIFFYYFLLQFTPI